MWFKDKDFWMKALGRALRSAAQGVLVGIGENVAIQNFDWKLIVGTALGMFVASIATSIALGVPEYDIDEE